MSRNQTGTKIVFVGNIPYGLSEEQISDIFSSAGRVVNFRLVYDRDNGKPKGFGFCQYPDADSAASAVRNLNDFDVMGRKLRVDYSNEDYDVMTGLGPPPPATTQTPSGLILPPGKDIPAGVSAADEISRVLRTLPPTQLLDVLVQMKQLAAGDPARATELLAQAPQLAYAVFQALLLMDLVSPEAINAVVDPNAPPPPPLPQPQPVAQAYVPPAPTAAAPGGQDELIKQVLELPQAVVDMLPEPDRTTVIALRMQYGR